MAQGRICRAADVSAVAMTPDLGAEVRGVDLSAPLSDACYARIVEIFHRYCVIFFRKQKLEPHHIVRFASHFGELDVDESAEHHLPGLPQVRVLSNATTNAQAMAVIRGGTHWHSESSYKPVPAAATLLYGIQCPPKGGNTEFANMYAAFEALSSERQAFLQRLRAVHDLKLLHAEGNLERPASSAEQLASAPPVEHPLVRVHPATGRKSLFVARHVVSHVLGMSVPESRRLIDELEAFAVQPRFMYAHRWQQGDVLVWDNRCTLHRATPYDGKYDRMLQRAQVKGEVPIAA